MIQRTQEQTARSIRDFYDDSIGRLKGRVQSDHSQLAALAEWLPPGETQARIQGMVESYSSIEGLLGRPGRSRSPTDRRPDGLSSRSRR